MERFVGNLYLHDEKLAPMLSVSIIKLKRDTSIQARVVYTEHCARLGALSKANQVITSNSIPNANPINIDHLRTQYP